MRDGFSLRREFVPVVNCIAGKFLRLGEKDSTKTCVVPDVVIRLIKLSNE